jgi:hypothetical protein
MNKLVLGLISLIAGAFLFLSPLPVRAQEPPPPTITPDIQNGLCAGASLDVTATCETAQISQEESAAKINEIIASIINIFSLIVGVVAVIMIIVGGLKYITSGGDSSNITGAKNTILYAIVGLIIVALSQVMVRFVLSRVT